MHRIEASAIRSFSVQDCCSLVIAILRELLASPHLRVKHIHIYRVTYREMTEHLPYVILTLMLNTHRAKVHRKPKRAKGVH